MKKELQQRLEALKQDFSQGQIELSEIKERQAHTHYTLLRLQGAIQVLEEILSEETDNLSTGEKEVGKKRC